MCWSYVVCLRTRLLGVWPLVEAAPVLSALFVGGCSWSSACLLSALGVASPPSNSLFMASAGSVFKKAYFVARRCGLCSGFRAGCSAGFCRGFCGGGGR